MTNDPTQPQPSPFAAPEPGPVPGQPPLQPPYAGQPPYASQPQGQPPYQGQPAPGPRPMAPSFIPPTVAAAAANPRRSSGPSIGTLAFVVAVVVAAAGLGFAGGRLTAPAAATARNGFGGNFGGAFAGGSFNPNASGNPGRGGLGGGFAGGSVSIDGQVTAVANGSITIQTANGQSVTLQLPSTVIYHAQASAAPSDVAVGSKVQVTVNRGGFGAEASGQPAPSGQPGGAGLGARGFTVTDITVLAK